MDNKPNGHTKDPPKSAPPEPETAPSVSLHDEEAADARAMSEVSPPPDAIRDLAASCVRFVERGLGKLESKANEGEAPVLRPGVRLDYTAETLPLLDHYLTMARLTLGLGASGGASRAAQEGEGGEGEGGEARARPARAASPLAAVHDGAPGPLRGPLPQTPRTAPTTAALIAQAAGAYLGEVIRRRHHAWWRTEGPDPMAYRVELGDVFLAISPMLLIAESFERDADGDYAGTAALDAAKIEMDEEDRRAAAERLSVLDVDEDEYYLPTTRLEVIDILVDTIRARRLNAGDPPDMNLTPEDYET